jgi:hypothetical protein
MLNYLENITMNTYWPGSVARMFFYTVQAASTLHKSYQGYSPGGKAAWDALIAAIANGRFKMDKSRLPTAKQKGYLELDRDYTIPEVLSAYAGEAALIGKALGLPGSRIVAYWKVAAERMRDDGVYPTSAVQALVNEAKPAFDKGALDAAYNQGAAAANAAASQTQEAQAQAAKAQADAAAQANAQATSYGSNIVDCSRGYKVAEFYLASLEATFKVMASYGPRTVDTAMTNSLKASPSMWTGLGNEDTKAELMAACLGTTPAKVKEVWATQRQDVWAKGKKPTVPSPATKALGKYVNSAAKSKAMSEPPMKPGFTDVAQPGIIQQMLPWLAVGAVGLGIMYFLSRKPATAPALANPARRYAR